MADKSGQTFELPKRSNQVAKVFATIQDYGDIDREKVVEIPLAEISDFPNHPFKVKIDDEMKNIYFRRNNHCNRACTRRHRL
ncbi:MAG: hypothetical protein FWC20_09675 [Oscillospiraceae bacterium]|nr:hypothetical protein [Oscillospiraceae bacterium]MCL2279657.1 hypothetical protein [Oscillospiraceae bacterium]